MCNQVFKVSVIVLTYNHGRYIRKALESIFAQKVNFEYEVLIGDDGSNDDTRNVLVEYHNRYEDKVKVYFSEVNQGATRNFCNLLSNASGEYIAFLEGDDYWCDEFKLKKQIDFLDGNKEYGSCSCLSYVVDEDGNINQKLTDRKDAVFWNFYKCEYTKEDFEQGYYSGHTGSMVMRNINKFSNIDLSVIYKLHPMIGDRTTQVIALKLGKVHNLQQYMSCYRFVENKNTSNWQAQTRANNKRGEEFCYIVNLEIYANDKLKLKLDLEKVKKDKFVSAVVFCMKNNNANNRKVVYEMIRKSLKPFKYSLYMVKVIALKQFYWKILKTDKSIKI